MRFATRLLPPALALIALTLLAGPTPAQESEKKPAPKGPKMDELSKKTYETYMKTVYTLRGAGVKTASFAVKVKYVSMTGSVGVIGRYRWDGSAGTLEWSDARQGRIAQEKGASKEIFDAEFERDPYLKALAGAELTATKRDDGKVLMKVSGKPVGIKSVLFGRNGLPEEEVLFQPGMKRDLVMRLDYRQVDGAWLLMGHTIDADIPKGKVRIRREITHARVSGFLVKKRSLSTTTISGATVGTLTIDYSDWKLSSGAR